LLVTNNVCAQRETPLVGSASLLAYARPSAMIGAGVPLLTIGTVLPARAVDGIDRIIA